MDKTPRAGRMHIGIFGRCNSGKSTILNALTGQQTAIVSPVKGTTTDPVYKSMELLPMGPVVLIDTPGLDDDTLIGEQRVAKTQEILRKTDVALMVVDSHQPLIRAEEELLAELEKREIPVLIVHNQKDNSPKHERARLSVNPAQQGTIEQLKEVLASYKPLERPKELLEGLSGENNIFLLVTPIDKGAPKGRLILPQQQTVRSILDSYGVSILVQPEQLDFTLKALNKNPDLVVVDSQVFGVVADILPEDIPLTSFSILFARLKGILPEAMKAVEAIPTLKSGDKILIAEGCTHHRQCEDIGTVKIPRWLQEHTDKELIFDFVSGGEFPPSLSDYKIVVHCGGCMLNNREMEFRLREAQRQNVPLINYGILIALLQGALKRSAPVINKII